MDTIRPYAKALVPLALGVVAVLVQWAYTGVLNAPELQTAIGALVTAAVVYATPNRTIVVPPLP
ncbi:MAG: hypothetical protein M3Y26_04570 [Actinomycetota bacterium]|nr:hypothetical protein [Actinomycetota bacterium]